MRYCFSLNEEDYEGDFETRQAAQDAAECEIEERGDEPRACWTAERGEMKASAYAPSVDSIVEGLQQRADEIAGDASEDWLAKLTPAAKSDLVAALKTMLDDWATKHDLHPQFFGIENVKEHPAP